MPAQYDDRRWRVAPDGSRTRAVMNAADYGVEATEAAIEAASEHNVDLVEVKGTGAGGRITKQDVESAADDD